jgi:hypothetical protein
LSLVRIQSPRPFFLPENAQLSGQALPHQTYRLLPSFTEFYRDLPLFLTQIWHRSVIAVIADSGAALAGFRASTEIIFSRAPHFVNGGGL